MHCENYVISTKVELHVTRNCSKRIFNQANEFCKLIIKLTQKRKSKNFKTLVTDIKLSPEHIESTEKKIVEKAKRKGEVTEVIPHRQ